MQCDVWLGSQLERSAIRQHSSAQGSFKWKLSSKKIPSSNIGACQMLGNRVGQALHIFISCLFAIFCFVFFTIILRGDRSMTILHVAEGISDKPRF